MQQVVVEIQPLLHAPRADGLREMIDLLQPDAHAVEIGMCGRDVDRPEIDVEDGNIADAAALAVTPAPAVDEIEVGIADARIAGIFSSPTPTFSPSNAHAPSSIARSNARRALATRSPIAQTPIPYSSA